MSVLTNWGYTITDADALGDMLTENEFNVMTANKYAGDVRIPANISAACMAIRNYCDWHIYPAQACEFTEYLLYGNGRIKQVGCDYVIQLPASCVTAISEITIDGIPWTRYSLSTNGVVHLFDVGRLVSRTSQVTVKYTAGLADGLMAGLKELIAHRVTHALASSAGVQSETAGGVSITYAANWINASRATALADDNKEVLAPYKLRGVF